MVGKTSANILVTSSDDTRKSITFLLTVPLPRSDWNFSPLTAVHFIVTRTVIRQENLVLFQSNALELISLSVLVTS